MNEETRLTQSVDAVLQSQYFIVIRNKIYAKTCSVDKFICESCRKAFRNDDIPRVSHIEKQVCIQCDMYLPEPVVFDKRQMRRHRLEYGELQVILDNSVF